MSGLRDRIAAVLRANGYWDGCTDWKCVLDPNCEGCLHESNEMADAVIEAILPQIAAQALRDAADDIYESRGPQQGMSTREWLEERATRLGEVGA